MIQQHSKEIYNRPIQVKFLCVTHTKQYRTNIAAMTYLCLWVDGCSVHKEDRVHEKWGKCQGKTFRSEAKNRLLTRGSLHFFGHSSRTARHQQQGERLSSSGSALCPLLNRQVLSMPFNTGSDSSVTTSAP